MINHTNPKLRIFLCYASQDKSIVRELYQRLTEQEWIDTWFDENKLLPGENWKTSIEEAVESSDFVIICLSNNSVNKDGFVQKELRYAREISLKKPEGSVFLIPVRLDDCKVPRELTSFQYTNYFGENKEQSYKSLVETFSKKYFQIAPNQKDPKPITSVLSSYYDEIDEKASYPDLSYGIPTGFIDLDKLLFNGMRESNLLVVGSKVNRNKTDFLLSILKNTALTYKKRVAVFMPLGMSNNEIVQHLIVQQTGIEHYRLNTGKFSASEWPLFTHAIEIFSDTQIFLDDTSNLTIDQIKEKSNKLFLENQIDLIIIDNLQFIRKNEITPRITADSDYLSLKVLARDLNIPILVGVQLPKITGGRFERPKLSDLHEFGHLEDLADVIMFIHHPEQSDIGDININLAEVILAKHDYGPVGYIELIYRSAIAKYENAIRIVLNRDKDP